MSAGGGRRIWQSGALGGGFISDICTASTERPVCNVAAAKTKGNTQAWILFNVSAPEGRKEHGAKTVLWSTVYIQMIVLPRQARDILGKNSKTSAVLSRGVVCAGRQRLDAKPLLHHAAAGRAATPVRGHGALCTRWERQWRRRVVASGRCAFRKRFGRGS